MRPVGAVPEECIPCRVRSAANKGPRVLPMHPEVKVIFKRRVGVGKVREALKRLA